MSMCNLYVLVKGLSQYVSETRSSNLIDKVYSCISCPICSIFLWISGFHFGKIQRCSPQRNVRIFLPNCTHRFFATKFDRKKSKIIHSVHIFPFRDFSRFLQQARAKLSQKAAPVFAPNPVPIMPSQAILPLVFQWRGFLQELGILFWKCRLTTINPLN